MIRKIILIIFQVFFGSILLGQPNHDARMLGLNGSYTTVARGYHSIGINPANLGVYKNWSINILNLSLGLSNNAFSLSNYNAVTGTHLGDTLAFNYYPKSQFYDMFGGKGIRFMQSLELPFPVLNFSTRKFAFTSGITTNIDMGMPNGFVDLLLFGNPFGKNISIDFEQFIILNQETGVSYGQSFNGISAGFTLKYILGLFYMGMESIDNPFITTDITGFTGQNQYLIQQAIGGSGIGLDIGLTTDESEEGFRFGFSIINLIGMVEWRQDHFIREKLENTLKNSAGDFYLRPNEFMYLNMVMDSVTGTSFSETSGDPLIYYEMYKVIPLPNLSNIDTNKVDSADFALAVELSNGTYLFPSAGKYKLVDLIGDNDEERPLDSDYYKVYSIADDNPFKTRQPMYLRMGVSRRWEGQAIVVADLVTGFANLYGSSSTWRASMGVEIIRFKGKFLRLGYAVGGVAKKSMSLGYGRKIGNLYWDIGMSFNGGFSLESAKGFDLAFGLTWQLGKKKI